VLSKGSWGKITKEAWNKMTTEVQRVFSLEAQFLFTEAVYFAVLQAPKYDRPPKGILLKHLCLFFMHWLVSGKSFDEYTEKEGLNLGISKGCLRQCLDYIVKRTGAFVDTYVKPRPPEEMEEIADKVYQELGLDLPAPEYKSIRRRNQGMKGVCLLIELKRSGSNEQTKANGAQTSMHPHKPVVVLAQHQRFGVEFQMLCKPAASLKKS